VSDPVWTVEGLARSCLSVDYPEELPRAERVSLFLQSVHAAWQLGGWEAASVLIRLQAKDP
jgi:hypothetical protein